MKIASVAYSSMAMSIGLRCAVLMCAALCFSASASAVNGTVRFRLLFASNGNSPLTTKCTATSISPYPAAGTSQVRSARPGRARRLAIAISRVTAIAAGANKMVSLVMAPYVNSAVASRYIRVPPRRKASRPPSMHASATGSAVSRPTLMTRPK